MTPGVIQVKTRANFELLVTFADGVCKQFSMLPYLQYPAFSQLSEPGRFAFAHVANGTVQWTDDIDISPDTLYLGGRPCNINSL
ncbi:hypothetical protein GALL_485750 [mine drainage metagenome]|uniref:DUF2442 domain-containing protein n=1 Tax=mine drainage metagenome TaxID=410659 RepID=A0A1J5Q1S7_9ZZZZ